MALEERSIRQEGFYHRQRLTESQPQTGRETDRLCMDHCLQASSAAPSHGGLADVTHMRLSSERLHGSMAVISFSTGSCKPRMLAAAARGGGGHGAEAGVKFGEDPPV